MKTILLLIAFLCITAGAFGQTAHGIVIVVTAGEDIAAYDGLKYDSASDTWKKMTTVGPPYRVEGVAVQDIANGETGNVIISGILQMIVPAPVAIGMSLCISTTDSSGGFCAETLAGENVLIGRVVSAAVGAGDVVQILIDGEIRTIQADAIYPTTVSIPSTTLTPFYDTLVDGKTEDLYTIFHIPAGFNRISATKTDSRILFIIWFTASVNTGNAYVGFVWHCERYSGVYNAGGGTGSITGSQAAAAIAAPASAYGRNGYALQIDTGTYGAELLNDSVCVFQIERQGAHASDTMASTMYIEGAELWL